MQIANQARAASKPSKKSQAIATQDKDLWQALRQRRMNLAKAQQVPPYVIFSDATLLAMIDTKPHNLLQMRQVHGVGEKKLQRYGEAFLSIINEHV